MAHESNLTGDFLDEQLTNSFNTPIGGRAIKLKNLTGAPSVKGTLVEANETTEDGFEILSDLYDCIGIIYEDGIADGEDCWVVVSGIAEVLLKDTTTSTTGNWVKASDTDGRADATLELPSGGTLPQLQEHFQEIGHCIETKVAGTDVLAKIVLHFN
jgi:hypothetical protein